MSIEEHVGFTIETGSNYALLYMFTVGSVLAYIAIIYNITILILLCRANLHQPTSELMQALALADLLTAFCSYGLEPLFQYKYTSINEESSMLTLDYPFCAMYVNLSQLTDLFHFVSVLLTLSLGMQKVLSLKFPYWFKANMTCKFARITALCCFVISVLVNIPRNCAIRFVNRDNITIPFFGQDFKRQQKTLTTCSSIVMSKQAFLYGTQFYPLTSAVFLLLCSTIMCLCVLYIVFRLCHRKCNRGSRSKTTRDRRSILMVTTVLVIFFISEIPRLAIEGYLFFGEYLGNMLEVEATNFLAFMVTDYRATLAINMKINSKLSFTSSLLIIESLKVFTLIGCMSNFVIYTTMCKQLRRELRKMFAISK